jgi:fucose permease
MSNTDDKDSSRHTMTDHYFSKFSITQKVIFVLVSISSCAGMLMTKADSPKTVLIGLALIVFGAIVFTSIRNCVKAKNGKDALE